MKKEIIIEKLTKLATRKTLNEEEQISFFVWLRHLIEEDKSDYPTVYLYSNWVLHPRLDQNIECGAIIIEMISSLEAVDVGGSLLSTILFLKSLRFKKLIDEILEVSKEYSIPMTLFTDNGIFVFLNQLIKNLLIGKPLEFNLEYHKAHNKECFNHISKKTIGRDILAVQSVCFNHNEKFDSKSDCQQESEYYVVYKNRNNISTLVPMEFNIWPVVFSDNRVQS